MINNLIEKYEEEKDLIYHDLLCNREGTNTYNELKGELHKTQEIIEDLEELKEKTTQKIKELIEYQDSTKEIIPIQITLAQKTELIGIIGGLGLGIMNLEEIIGE